MRMTWYWKCMVVALIGVAFCCLANGETNGSSNRIRKPAKPLDLKIPIGKIQEKLNDLLKRGLDLGLLLQTLVKVLTECLPTQSQRNSEGPFVLPENLKQEVNKIPEQYLAHFNTLIPQENITQYCNSSSYRTIHNFLWVEKGPGEQHKDLVEFFFNFGYPNIYNAVRAIYEKNECPQDLIDSLPNGPEPRNPSPTAYNPTSIRSQILSDSQRERTLLPYQTQCNITEIITDIIKSGALELLSLVETLVYEVATDPNLHFLVGKIQEPAKGPAFREFRLLDPVRDLFDLVHKALVENETILSILELVESLTGLDLTKLNLVEVVLNILEALLWGNFEPVVPRPQP